MPINCKLPSGKSTISYGQANLGINPDGSVDVPPYVAKSLIAAGCTTTSNTSLTPSVATMLNAAQPSDANYMIWAYGQTIGVNPYVAAPAEGQPAPVYDPLAHAQAALTARGEPAVTIS